MAGTTVFSAANNGGALAASANNAFEVLNGTTGATAIASESTCNYTQQEAHTRSNLYVNVFQNTTGTSSGTIAFRVNNAAGNESITIPLATTGEQTDTTHTDVIAASATTDYQQTGGGSGTWQSFTLGNLCTPASATTFLTHCCDGPNAGYSANSFYQAISGQNWTTAGTEARAQWQIQAACTFQNLYAQIDNYSGSPSVVIYFRLNAANGNQSITPTALGPFTDTTHTDSAASGAKVNYYVDITALGTTFGTTYLAVDQTSTTYQVTYGNGYPGGIAFNTSATAYIPLTGRFQNNAVEADVQCKTGTTFTASSFQSYVEANGVTATSTFTFRLGAAAGNQSVSYASTVGGWATDSVHTDSVLPTTEINYQIVTGSTGGSITPTNMSFTATLPAPAVTTGAAAILMAM